jgi:hypothetical protein
MMAAIAAIANTIMRNPHRSILATIGRAGIGLAPG